MEQFLTFFKVAFILGMYRPLGELFKMVLIKTAFFAVWEILPSKLLTHNFRMPITSDINRTTKIVDRELTFTFDVVSASVIVFIHTLLVLVKVKGTSLKKCL